MTQSTNPGLSGWLIDSARRNPEGALLLAAGAVLLLRQSGALSAVGQSEVAQLATETVRETADTAKGYASDFAEKASDSAKSFGSDVKNYAQSTKAGITKQARSAAETANSSIKSAIESVVREQPLLIALAGIAAGAGVAAVFPVSSMEKEAFEPVTKHVEDAVEYASAEAKDALGRAGDKLKEVVQDKGLTADGLKRMAGEVISAAGGAPKTNITGETK